MDVKMRNLKQLKQKLAVFLLCLATAGLASAQYTPESYPAPPSIPGPNKFLNQTQMNGSLNNWNYGVTNTLYLQTANNPSNPTSLSDLNLTLGVNNVTFNNVQYATVCFGGSDESSYYDGATNFGCGNANITFSGVNTFGAEDNGVSANFGGTNDWEAMMDLTPGNANVTFATDSTTTFYGRTNFGSENNAFANGANTVSTVLFDLGSNVSFYQQNTYFGTGGYNTYNSDTGLYTGSANGGDAVLTFGGTTAAITRTGLDDLNGVKVYQRIMIGGGATSFTTNHSLDGSQDYDSTINRKTGHSTIVFNNGYNKFYWDKAANNPDPYSDYYGFTASATSGSQGIAESGGVDLTIDGGINYFYTETRIGGGYDFNTFGNINTSSDDFEIVWGGVNNIAIGTVGVDGGGIHNIFDGRTFFGAANGETNMDFNAGKTYFYGETTSYHMSLADVRPGGTGTGASNNYNGQDIPYVYFGGKQLNNEGTEQNDQSYYNIYYRQDDANNSAFLIYDNQVDWTRAPKTVVNFNGGINRFKTVGFFGGANYNYLDGSVDAQKAVISTTTSMDANAFTDDSYNFIAKSGQVLADYANYQRYVDDPDNPDYQQYKNLFTAEEAAQIAATPSNVFLYRDTQGRLCTYSMMLQDQGGADVSLTGGTVWLGVSNQTQLLMEYADGRETNVYSSNRNEQVQLIGANASFTGTDGVLKFSINKNGQTVKNYEGDQVQQLNAGRLVFSDMTIAGGFDPTSGVVIQVAEAATLMNLGAGTQEYFTIETFENSQGNQLKIGENVNGQYKYFKDYAFYSVGVEDLSSDLMSTGDPSLNFKDQARLHVYAKDPREVLVGEGNLGHNVDDFFEFAQDVEENEGNYPDDGDGYPEDVYDIVDNVVQAPTKKDALEIFDVEFGGAYGSNVHAQLRRLSMINNSITSRVINQDMGLDKICPRCCNCGCECNTDGSCYSCGFGCGYGRQCNTCRPGMSVWGSFFADDGVSDAYKGYTPYKYDTNGGIIGLERQTERCGRWGLYYAMSQSHMKIHSMVGSHFLDSDDHLLGLYGKWDSCLAGGYTMINGNVSYNDYDSARYLQTNNTQADNFHAGYGGLQASASIERGWAWVIKHGFVFNPFLSAQYSYYNTDGFDESGTSKSIALRVSELDYSSVRSNVGFRINRDFVFGYQDSQNLRLTINASWVHECLHKTVEYETQLMYNTYATGTAYDGYASPVWKMRGNSTGNDWANVGFGLNYDISDRWVISGGYNVFLNEYTTVHSGTGTLQMNF